VDISEAISFFSHSIVGESKYSRSGKRIKLNKKSTSSQLLPEIRIIIGGPPNSGKSTLVNSLKRALWEIGVNVNSAELDLWAPTLEFLEGKISKQERDSRKQKKVTKEEAEEASKRLVEASQDGSIAIGDCPGKISEELKIIVKNATHAIILCRADQVQEMESWRKFFSEVGIPIVGELVSDLNENEDVQISGSGLITGRLVGLDRDVGRKGSPAISQLAFLLKSVLEL
jgi:CRISPR-associated protein Csx3